MHCADEAADLSLLRESVVDLSLLDVSVVEYKDTTGNRVVGDVSEPRVVLSVVT